MFFSFAIRAASPKPEARRMFEVPARRFFSCAPPKIRGENGAEFRAKSAPIPTGPPIL